eukprot:5936828-Pyramimonas_sp.AAC.1
MYLGREPIARGHKAYTRERSVVLQQAEERGFKGGTTLISAFRKKAFCGILTARTAFQRPEAKGRRHIPARGGV